MDGITLGNASFAGEDSRTIFFHPPRYWSRIVQPCPGNRFVILVWPASYLAIA